MSHFHRYWWGEANQHIRTMRAVWPAKPIKSAGTDQPSEQASPSEQHSPQRGSDAVGHSKETPIRGHDEQRLMLP